MESGSSSKDCGGKRIIFEEDIILTMPNSVQCLNVLAIQHGSSIF